MILISKWFTFILLSLAHNKLSLVLPPSCTGLTLADLIFFEPKSNDLGLPLLPANPVWLPVTDLSLALAPSLIALKFRLLFITQVPDLLLTKSLLYLLPKSTSLGQLGLTLFLNRISSLANFISYVKEINY